MPRRIVEVAPAMEASTTIGSRKAVSGLNGTIFSWPASPAALTAGYSFHQPSCLGSATCSPDQTLS